MIPSILITEIMIMSKEYLIFIVFIKNKERTTWLTKTLN